MRPTLRECTMTMRMSAKSFSVASSPQAACRCRLPAVSGSAWAHEVWLQDACLTQEQSMLPANHAGCLQFAGACRLPVQLVPAGSHMLLLQIVYHVPLHEPAQGMQQAATGCC